MQLDYKELRALHTAAGRREQGCFLAEGHHLVGEALKWGKLRLLVVEAGREDACREEIAQAEEKGVPVYSVPASRMKSLTQTATSQGLIAAVEYRHREFDPKALPESGLLCFLERVQDPGNVGTVLRTLDALGAEGLLLTQDSADPANDKALRASMGAIYRVPVYRIEDRLSALRSLRDAGWEIFCGDLHGEDFFRAKRDFQKQIFLVGNEGAGVTHEAASLASQRVRLPMPGQAESLNAAIAASVCLYDMAREMGRF